MQINLWFYIFCVAVNRASAIVIGQAKVTESSADSRNDTFFKGNATQPYIENKPTSEMVNDSNMSGKYNESNSGNTMDDITRGDDKEHLDSIEATIEVLNNKFVSNVAIKNATAQAVTENFIKLDVTEFENSTENNSSEEYAKITLDARDVSDFNIINTTSVFSSNKTLETIDLPTKKRSLAIIAEARSKILPEKYKGLENPPTMLPIFRPNESSNQKVNLNCCPLVKYSFDTVPNIRRLLKKSTLTPKRSQNVKATPAFNEALNVLAKTLNDKMVSNNRYSPMAISMPAFINSQQIISTPNSPYLGINSLFNPYILTSNSGAPSVEPLPINNRQIPLFFIAPSLNPIQSNEKVSQTYSIQTNNLGIKPSDCVAPSVYQPLMLKPLITNKEITPTLASPEINSLKFSPMQITNFKSLPFLLSAFTPTKCSQSSVLEISPCKGQKAVLGKPTFTVSPALNANAAISLSSKINCLPSNHNKAAAVPMKNLVLLTKNINPLSTLTKAICPCLNYNRNPVLKVANPSVQNSGSILLNRGLFNHVEVTSPNVKFSNCKPSTSERSPNLNYRQVINYSQLPKKNQSGLKRNMFKNITDKSQIAYRPQTVTFTQVYDNFLKKITLEILIPYTLSNR